MSKSEDDSKVETKCFGGCGKDVSNENEVCSECNKGDE